VHIAIIGSRDYLPLDKVRDYVNTLADDDHIISGGARGVDSAAVAAAKQRGLPFTEYRAEWDRYGRSAGFKRNVLIVNDADRLVAFWDGQSRGTKHSINLAAKKGIPVEIIGDK
jgi:hypothetical protein